MSKESTFHSNALNVSAFLGGTTFAALILIIEVKEKFRHADWLITATAAVSIFFIISTIGMIHIASGNKTKGKTFANTMEWFSSAGFIGLMGIMSYVVWQFTKIGGIVVGLLALSTFVTLNVLRLKE